MNTSTTDEKLDEVFQLFLLPKYNVASPTYLDLLFTHISEKSNECRLLDEAHVDKYADWVAKALGVWATDGKPCQAVGVFVIRLVGLVAREEHNFLRLRQEDVFRKLCDALDLRKDGLSASLKMAYTTMLSDALTHKSGRLWLKESGLWIDIVKFAHENHTLYVTRESHRFLSSLLLHETPDIEFCTEIVKAIGEPVTKTTVNGETYPSLEDLYVHQNKQLCNALNLITNIMENTLFTSLENTIPDLFENLLNLESRIRALFMVSISGQFFQHIHKLWILLNVRTLKEGLSTDTTVVKTDKWEKFRQGLCLCQMLLLSKKYVIEFVMTHKISLIYWKKLQTLHEFTLPLELEHKFEHQVIALMITPLCVCIRSNYTKGHDFFEMFVDKLFDVTCHPVQRMVYNAKAIMYGSDDLPLEKICRATVDMVLDLIDVMDRDSAVIAFQMFCHVLKNYIPARCAAHSETEPPWAHDQQIRPSRKSILDNDPIVEMPGLLSALLNSVTLMAEKFKFKWKECVETICVLFLAEAITKHSGVRSTICVQSLKLCKLAIQDFMPPNLVLLVDCDSQMGGLGPTLYKRLHDPNWEVRDSVFETLNTIAGISEYKYPAFQDFLLINQFLQLAVDIAMTDGESYVRASALVFISTTIRINKLWDEKMSQLDLPEKAINLLKEESEGVVRREAAMLIKELYLYRKWPKTMIDTMTRAMTEAAVLDLHWEVKVNALEYWSYFITSHLTDQGMLDGSFPSVTFSKEHRKIVTLNDTEIKRRLNKALDELAKQSCLGVLLVTLEDESDFEVSKTSAAIIGRLKKFLIEYKVNEPQPPFPSAKDSAIIDTAYVKKSPSSNNSGSKNVNDSSANVIDEIADANDANLLASLWQNSMKMTGDEENSKAETLRYLSSVTKDDFLRAVLNTDLDAYVEERKRWLTTYTNSFESVLEDIITAHRSNDVNSMDCY